MSPPLSCRRVNADPEGFRVSFDGVDIGSISERQQHTQHRTYWAWGVDAMPRMDHGGYPPHGEAESFEDALAAFRAAFDAWHAKIAPTVWHRNIEHKRAGQERWRK